MLSGRDTGLYHRASWWPPPKVRSELPGEPDCGMLEQVVDVRTFPGIEASR